MIRTTRTLPLYFPFALPKRVVGGCYTTPFLPNPRILDTFKLMSDYRTATESVERESPGYFDRMDKVYFNYAEQFKEHSTFTQIFKDIETFHENVFPHIERVLEKNHRMVKEYKEAHEEFQNNPSCFHRCFELTLWISALEENTKLPRSIASYVEGYKKKYEHFHPMKMRLERVTFKEENHSYERFYYNPNSQEINIRLRLWNKIPPSYQAHTLLHELRHTAQTHRSIYDDFGFGPSIAQNEQDADASACSQLPCETCLKVNQLYIERNPICQPGYFQTADFSPFIEENKGKRCLAHSKDTEELDTALAKRNWNAVEKLDKSMGSFLDRVPPL